MEIYLIQYITILKLVYRNFKLLVYKIDIYKGQEENKWLVKKIINCKEINNKIWYKVLWEGYDKTIQKLKGNLENTKGKLQVFIFIFIFIFLSLLYYTTCNTAHTALGYSAIVLYT